ISASAPAAMAFMVRTMVISWVCGSGAVRMVTSRFGVSAAAALALVRASSGAGRRLGFVGISFVPSSGSLVHDSDTERLSVPASPTDFINQRCRNVHSCVRIYETMHLHGRDFRDVFALFTGAGRGCHPRRAAGIFANPRPAPPLKINPL